MAWLVCGQRAESCMARRERSAKRQKITAAFHLSSASCSNAPTVRLATVGSWRILSSAKQACELLCRNDSQAVRDSQKSQFRSRKVSPGRGVRCKAGSRRNRWAQPHQGPYVLLNPSSHPGLTSNSQRAKNIDVPSPAWTRPILLLILWVTIALWTERNNPVGFIPR